MNLVPAKPVPLNVSLAAELTTVRAELALLLASVLQTFGWNVRTDVLLADRVLLQPRKVGVAVLAATVGSVLAGGVIYAVGWLAGQMGGLQLVVDLGLGRMLVFLQAGLQDHGFWLVLAAGIASFPYGVLLALAGFLGAAPLWLLPAALLARGLRFGVPGWLLWRGGMRYRDWLMRSYQGLTMVIALGMLLSLIFLLLLDATRTTGG